MQLKGHRSKDNLKKIVVIVIQLIVLGSLYMNLDLHAFICLTMIFPRWLKN